MTTGPLPDWPAIVRGLLLQRPGAKMRSSVVMHGADEVNAWMREGLKAGSFYAAEAGQVVGAEPSREGYVQAYMPPIEQPKAGSRRGG